MFSGYKAYVTGSSGFVMDDITGRAFLWEVTMAYEVGGRSDKYGNRFELNWVISKLLDVIEERIASVVVEALGDDEQGVDLWIEYKSGVREAQQCKGRNGSLEYWNYGTANSRAIWENWKHHLEQSKTDNVSLVSPISFTMLEDICNRARTNNCNAQDFYNNQILQSGRETITLFKNICKANNWLETQKGEQHSWFQAEAYFVRNQDAEELYKLSLDTDFWGQWFSRGNSSTMRMFGEYPWSPACNELRNYEWENADGTPQVTNSFDISKVSVMNATINALWESQYDASFQEYPKQDIPCLKLLEDLKLHEGVINGNFYDEKERLIAFDSCNVGIPEGLVIRMDALQSFLNENDFQLFWILLAEKRFYCGGRSTNQRWSEWSGAALLKGDSFEQEMHCTNLEKMRG